MGKVSSEMKGRQMQSGGDSLSYEKKKRKRKICGDNGLCHICPLHDGENWRRRHNNDRSKPKKKK